MAADPQSARSSDASEADGPESVDDHPSSQPDRADTRSTRVTRPGSLSPRRSGTLRNPRTTTAVLARSGEMGRVVQFPGSALPLAGGSAVAERTARISESIAGFEQTDRLRRVVNVTLAVVFMIPASLVLAVLWVLHRVFEHDRGQFIYKGRRLGKGKRLFTIYKIRTLSRDAEKVLGANLHVPNGKMETNFGRFLRATRLDELPQLFNIVRGDMDFVGPRPVRPEAYERYRKMIPDYDRTFLVRPGLTGYSQFFTPHSTPKQIRSRIDYRFLTRTPNPFRDVGFILTTAFTVLRNTVREGFHSTADRLRIFRSRLALARASLEVSSLTNKRVTRRVVREDVQAFLTDEAFSPQVRINCDLVDINHEALCIESPVTLELNQPVYLVIETFSRRSGRRKRARCRGFVYRAKGATTAPPGNGSGNGNGNGDGNGNGHAASDGNGEIDLKVGGASCFVVFYEPVTHLNRYLVDQYVLRYSIG